MSAVPRPGLSSETPDIEEAIQRHLFPILILALLSDGCSTAQNRHVSNVWRCPMLGGTHTRAFTLQDQEVTMINSLLNKLSPTEIRAVLSKDFH